MSKFEGWTSVADVLDSMAAEAESSDDDELLDEGQRASIRVIADRLRDGRRALLIADEVGMGKTRIAVALVDAVRRCGGRSAVVMPAGLGAQWQLELRHFNPEDKTLLPLRSYESFIRGFSSEDADGLPSRRKAKLADRRLQRELPSNGQWCEEKILMISHAFARMTFPLPTNGRLPWRRELMPAIEALCNRRRRNLQNGGRDERRATHRAARAAYETFAIQNLAIDRARDWRHVSSDDYRRAVLPVIGRALGQFDLVVIDEAHKARGQDSSLSRILGPLTWESTDPFRLGLTATPVELGADQWLDTLKRLVDTRNGGESHGLSRLEKPIADYSDTARRLRAEPLSEAIVKQFETTAKDFSCTLGPYVIRRDKRTEKELEAFRKRENVDYRDIQMVSVDPAKVGCDWLRAFCAAEALSLLPKADRAAKRNRLMLEKAHGLDQLIMQDSVAAQSEQLDFWSRNASLPGETSIFEHPAISAAVNTIEAATADGRKVLVFGTLVKPLRALTRLLDARAMLRCLAGERHWPGRQVPSGAEEAILSALRAEDCPPSVPDSIEGINLLLKTRYEAARRKRVSNLRTVHRAIVERALAGDKTASLILEICPAGASNEISGEIGIAMLLEALEGRLPRRSEDQDAGQLMNWTADHLLAEMSALIAELAHGSSDSFEDEATNGSSAQRQDRLQLLRNHLSDYSGREGSFARLLYGDTRPQTRRLLQASFNRRDSWPMVLVAQSTVGREGLNLHEECRTVVLLHAEWNPGVVEQQIGRVDRKNSRFFKDYRAYLSQNGCGPPPRIEIHCIKVDGGYDSFHWAVLKERWADLRAQLHGDVVASRDRERAQTDPQLGSLIRRLDRAAPDFHPKPTMSSP